METPLSGSHLGPHCKRFSRSVQQGRLQRSSLFLVHALRAACSSLNIESASRSSTTNANTACQEEEVPSEKLERSFMALNHIAAAIIAFRKMTLKANIIYG
jgi:hypothetical protein